jgi:hypothetical protein
MVKNKVSTIETAQRFLQIKKMFGLFWAAKTG